MRIAIHKKQNGFSSKWIEYCKKNQVKYKIVNCYSNSIIGNLNDCDALMWHFHHANPKDVLFAKQLLFSLEISGKIVFPDFHTSWHFDDKVGQKYLLETLDLPLVPSYVFYEKKAALKWIEETDFPKVFKLRGGAGSSNVKIAETKANGRKFVRKAFGRGYSLYDNCGRLKERWYQYRRGKAGLWNVLKGILRIGKTPKFAKIEGRERGYVYFQDFVPGNDHDIRVVVVDGKAFAIKRLVRKGDFRASGSGAVLYEKHHFDEKTLELSFKVADMLKSQCLALDYVYKDGEPLIVEISYGFIKGSCEGYWDRDLNWHPGPFDAQGWMVETVLKQARP